MEVASPKAINRYFKNEVRNEEANTGTKAIILRRYVALTETLASQPKIPSTQAEFNRTVLEDRVYCSSLPTQPTKTDMETVRNLSPGDFRDGLMIALDYANMLQGHGKGFEWIESWHRRFPKQVDDRARTEITQAWACFCRLDKYIKDQGDHTTGVKVYEELLNLPVVQGLDTILRSNGPETIKKIVETMRRIQPVLVGGEKLTAGGSNPFILLFRTLNSLKGGANVCEQHESAQKPKEACHADKRCTYIPGTTKDGKRTKPRCILDEQSAEEGINETGIMGTTAVSMVFFALLLLYIVDTGENTWYDIMMFPHTFYNNFFEQVGQADEMAEIFGSVLGGGGVFLWLVKGTTAATLATLNIPGVVAGSILIGVSTLLTGSLFGTVTRMMDGVTMTHHRYIAVATFYRTAVLSLFAIAYEVNAKVWNALRGRNRKKIDIVHIGDRLTQFFTINLGNLAAYAATYKINVADPVLNFAIFGLFAMIGHFLPSAYGWVKNAVYACSSGSRRRTITQFDQRQPPALKDKPAAGPAAAVGKCECRLKKDGTRCRFNKKPGSDFCGHHTNCLDRFDSVEARDGDSSSSEELEDADDQSDFSSSEDESSSEELGDSSSSEEEKSEDDFSN